MEKIWRYLYRGLDASSAKWKFKNNFVKADLKQKYSARFSFPYFSLEGNFDGKKKELNGNATISYDRYKLGVNYSTPNINSKFDIKQLNFNFQANRIPINQYVILDTIYASSKNVLVLCASTPFYNASGSISLSKDPVLKGEFEYSKIPFSFELSKKELMLNACLWIAEGVSLELMPKILFPTQTKDVAYQFSAHFSFIQPNFSFESKYCTSDYSILVRAATSIDNFFFSYTTRIKDQRAFNLINAKFRAPNSIIGIKFISMKYPVLKFKTDNPNIPCISLSINVNDVITLIKKYNQ